MSMLHMLALAVSLVGLPGETDVRGTVVDASGKPAAGAEVFIARRMLNPDGTMAAMAGTRADADGRFNLPTPLGGNWEWWHVWAWRDGHGMGIDRVLAPQEAGRTVPEVRLGLRPEGLRTITLKRDDGQPIAGAAIAPFVIACPFLAMLPDGLTSRLVDTTDAQGQAKIRGLAPDDRLIAVRVTLPELGSMVVDLVDRDQIRAQRSPPSQARSESVTLKLPPLGRLAGTVHRPDGTPVAGVVVEVWSRGTNYSNPAPVRFAGEPLRTDADGAFRTPLMLPSGLLHRVVVRVEGSEPILSDWLTVASGDGSEPLRLTLHPLRDVEGRVVDRQGKPIAGVTVFQAGDGPAPTSTTTGKTGRFRLSGFKRGPVSLFARADGFRFHGQRLDEAGDGVEVVLTWFDEPSSEAMTTLDLPIPAEERKAMAHRLLDPYLEKVLPSKEEPGKTWALRSLLHINPAEALEALERTTFERTSSPALVREETAIELAKIDPQEAEAVVEAIEDPFRRSDAMCSLWKKLPDAERERKRALIQRAIPLADAVTDVSNKVWILGRIGDGLLDLGDTEAARPILEKGKTIASKIVDKTDFGRGALVMALSRLDLPSALAMVETVQDRDEKGVLLRNIAARLAKSDPSGAERVLNAIDDPGERFGAPERICHELAAANPALALRIARAQPHGVDRAHSLLFFALGIKDRDHVQAIAAFREAMAEIDRMSTTTGLESLTTAAVLPIVEAIDPALVPEVFWRVLAQRAPSHDPRYVLGNNEFQTLPLLLARYDRRVAADLFATSLAFARRHPEDPAATSPTIVQTLGMIDPARAVAFVEAMPPEPKPNTNGANWARIILSKSLAQSKDARWHAIWRTSSGIGSLLDQGDLW